MEVDGHNERVAILDAGAQYGKVSFSCYHVPTYTYTGTICGVVVQ